MENFLFNLYFKVPLKVRSFIVRKIIQKEGQMYSLTLRAIFKKDFNITIGYGTYGGCFNSNNIPPGVVFGNYCSIAENIKIFRANHPKETFTSHPLLYNPVAGFVKKDLLVRPKLTIGHDVWIGEGTIILPNVKNIGNGSIIGAGSIVTKDVQPYSVVFGNPAKEKSKRFNPEVIDSLEKTKWWELSKELLILRIDDLNKIAKNKDI
jgi:virginiamycin A acetyltransferase